MNASENGPQERPQVDVGLPVGPPLPPGPAARMKDDYRALDQPLGVWSVARAMLRHPGRVVYELHHGRPAALIGLLAGIAVACLAAYGLTVGMFGWGVQLWAAPLKIALGGVLSALICLPSLFIFACLSGSDGTGAEICGILAGMLCLAALLLVGFAPVSWLFSQSTTSACFMGGLHLAFWCIGLKYGLGFLHQAFALLRGTQVRHLALWSAIFVLVSLQMTTTLRPIVGTSDRFLQTEKKFFVTHWMDSLDD